MPTSVAKKRKSNYPKRKVTSKKLAQKKLIATCPKHCKSDFNIIKEKDRPDHKKYYLICKKCKTDFIVTTFKR